MDQQLEQWVFVSGLGVHRVSVDQYLNSLYIYNVEDHTDGGP